MIIELIDNGMLNGLSTRETPYGDHVDNRSAIHNISDFESVDGIARVMGGQPVSLRISHKGRVRLAELEQALRTGRDRDPTGTVFSLRHREQDLTVALVSASVDEPVAVAMLDMNGLKEINYGPGGHSTGDAAIVATSSWSSCEIPA